MSDPDRSRYIIPNLRNACRVLREIGDCDDGLTVAEACRRLGLPQTTALRIFATLESEGFLERSGRVYRLGGALTLLHLQKVRQFDLAEIAKPVMEELAREAGETAHLAVPLGFNVLIIGVCECPHPVRATSQVGTRAEMHCSATGKVFIAYMYADRIDEFVSAAPLNARTERTITTRDELVREVERVRRDGYAVDNEEFYDGVRCLAAPIFDRHGRIVAAVGVTGGAQRFSRKRIPPVSRLVKAAAKDISARIDI